MISTQDTNFAESPVYLFPDQRAVNFIALRRFCITLNSNSFRLQRTIAVPYSQIASGS